MLFSVYTNVCKIASTVCLENVLPLTCYNLDIHDPIVIVFGRNVTEKVRNQTMLCFPPHLSTREVRSCSYRTVDKVTHFMSVTDGRTDRTIVAQPRAIQMSLAFAFIEKCVAFE